MCGGALVRRKAPEKNFWSCPSTFLALKVQLVVLMSAFVMVSTGWSVYCLLFFYSRCPAVCKIEEGHVPPCPMESAPLVSVCLDSGYAHVCVTTFRCNCHTVSRVATSLYNADLRAVDITEQYFHFRDNIIAVFIIERTAPIAIGHYGRRTQMSLLALFAARCHHRARGMMSWA